MKRMKLRVGDPVTVKVVRSVPGRVVATRARGFSEENDANVTVETVDGKREELPEEDVTLADIVGAVAMLERAEPISVKIEGLLTMKGEGIHVHSRMFIGKPGCTRANVCSHGLTMRIPEWLAFTSALKLGAALSDGKVEVEVPHEPRRTEAGEPAHGCETCDGEDECTCPHKNLRAKCLTCGGTWPECGK